MDVQKIFERYEVKYLITKRQQKELLAALGGRIVPDRYPHSTICNLYFDTPDGLLIRTSLDHPFYKEKLRLRSYGVPTDDSQVFLELKKKCGEIVYKRREAMTLGAANEFLLTQTAGSQISREIAYALHFYRELQPAMFLSYERDSYAGTEDEGLRLTFDTDVRYRDYDLDLTRGIYGTSALPEGGVLLEIKCGDAMPLYLARILSELGIFKTSFSKYGKAYSDTKLTAKGGQDHARLVS